MKYVAAILVLTFSLFVTPSHAQVKWLSWTEAEEAYQQDLNAGRQPKMYFVDLYTDWCGWCKKMEKTTFENKLVSEYLNKYFYPIHYNAESRQTEKIRGQEYGFKTEGNRGYNELAKILLDGQMKYPTVVFINSQFEILQRVPGYLDDLTFYTIINYMASTDYGKVGWPSFEAAFRASHQEEVAAAAKKD
jgi:thioredoxin-related protein